MAAGSWRRLLPTLVLALAAGLVPAAPAAAGSLVEEMTEKRSARYFLKHLCIWNEAIDIVQRDVYGPDNIIRLSEVRRRFTQIKKISRPYARSHYVLSRALLTPPADWPASVSGPVDNMAGKLLRMHRLLRRAANADTPRRWMTLTDDAQAIGRRLPSATIRSRLDLPPPGEGC